MHRILLAGLVFLLGGAQAIGSDIPLISGGVSGKFVVHTPLAIPPIQWSIESVAQDKRDNRIVLNAESEGVAARVLVVLPRSGAAGMWQIIHGEVDMNVWWQVLRKDERLAALPDDLKLSGTIQLTGEGSLTGWRPHGTLDAVWREGAVSSSEQKWSVPEFEFSVRLDLSNGEPAVRRVSLRAPRVEVMGLSLDTLQADAVRVEEGQLYWKQLGVNLLGGRMEVSPMVSDYNKPDLKTTVRLADLDLRELAGLVPMALHEGRGRLNGSLDIGWNGATGFWVKNGILRLAAEMPAEILLAENPNFLTQHVSRKIQWLPAFTGSLGKQLAVDNPAYDTLQRIEMGQLPLAVKTLEVSLYPQGMEGVETARVSVVASPVDTKVVEEVSFEVSVSGPLKEVLKLSTDERVKIGVSSN